MRALVLMLLLPTSSLAVARGDYRAATGVTFVQPSAFGIGLQAQVQFIACPKDSVTPPGGPCENLITQAASDNEYDARKQPEGCTPGVNCYESDGEPSPFTSPAADVTAEADRNSLACSATMHPIETWEASVQYDQGAPPGYPIDEAYAFCTLHQAWQGLAGKTYKVWYDSLSTWGDEPTTTQLTMTCGSTTKNFDSNAGGPLPQIALAADTPCTLRLSTSDHVWVDYPTDPQRSERMTSHTRAGVSYWTTQQQGGGCGLGFELLALPAWWAARRVREFKRRE